MEKLFVAVTIACLGTILISVSAHAARNLAFDDKGNLFVRDGNTIFKFTPDGVKSTFASGIVPETYDSYHVAEVFAGLALDRSGNSFVPEHVSGSILKFTPDGKKSTFATGVSPYKMLVDGAGNLFVTYGVSINLLVTLDV